MSRDPAPHWMATELATALLGWASEARRLLQRTRSAHNAAAAGDLVATGTRVALGSPEDAVRHALTHDGLESALRGAEALWIVWPSLRPVDRHRCAPLLARCALLGGDSAAAQRLLSWSGSEHVKTLDALRAALRELATGGERGPWHAEAHGLDPYAAAQAIERGELTARALTSYTLQHPAQFLRRRELALLFHNTRRAPRDLRYLRAFLRQFSQVGLITRPDAQGFTAIDFEPGQTSSTRDDTVSVLMSAFDSDATVVRAARSVLAQTHQNLELLICDDASNDTTCSVLQAAFRDEPRVRLFQSATNQGAYNVRNALAREARGAFVTFHDADDISLPGRISRQLETLGRSESHASVVDWLRVRPDGNVVFFADGTAQRMSVVSMLVRKSTLESVLPYPGARFGADQDVQRRIVRAFGKRAIVRVREPWLLGLWSSSSVTRQVDSAALESGYRSPARRGYSERLYQRDEFGTVDDASIADYLVDSDNWRPAQPLRRL